MINLSDYADNESLRNGIVRSNLDKLPALVQIVLEEINGKIYQLSYTNHTLNKLAISANGGFWLAVDYWCD